MFLNPNSVTNYFILMLFQFFVSDTLHFKICKPMSSTLLRIYDDNYDSMTCMAMTIIIYFNSAGLFRAEQPQNSETQISNGCLTILTVKTLFLYM